MFLGRFSVKLAEPRAHTLSTRASELRHAAHRTLDQNSNSGSLQLYPPLHQKKIPYMRSTFPAATTPGVSHAPCCHVEFAPPAFQSVSGRDARRRRIGPCARQTPAIRVRFLSHRPLAILRNPQPSVPCRSSQRRTSSWPAPLRPGSGSAPRSARFARAMAVSLAGEDSASDRLTARCTSLLMLPSESSTRRGS